MGPAGQRWRGTRGSAEAAGPAACSAGPRDAQKGKPAWAGAEEKGALGFGPSGEEGKAAVWKRKWAAWEGNGASQKQRKEKEI